MVTVPESEKICQVLNPVRCNIERSSESIGNIKALADRKNKTMDCMIQARS